MTQLRPNERRRSVRTSRESRGFAVVAVLIIMALMLSLGMTYMRRTSMRSQSSPAYRKTVQAKEAVASGIEFARQAVSAGQSVDRTVIDAGHKGAMIDVTDLDDGRVLRMEAGALDASGLGTTLLMESQRLASSGGAPLSHPDQLPRIPMDVVFAILADATITNTSFSGTVLVEDEVLTGLVILEAGASVTLHDVVVQGSIVSRAALEGSPPGDFDAAGGPELILDGQFRLEPADFLPDVAMVIPDGTVRTSFAEGRFQIRGSLVAHTIELNRKGILHGSLAFVELTLSDLVDRPGHGRDPELLADVLEPGSAWVDSQFVVLPRIEGASDLSNIKDFWSDDP